MRNPVNLRWLTPVLLTINMGILGYLVTRIDAVKYYVDDIIQPLQKQVERFQDDMSEIKGDIRVIKYHVKLNQ